MASIINAATSGGLVTTADTSGVLQLQTASTTAVTVNASQNVGIGTASPGARLQVVSSASSGVYGAIIYNQSATGQGLTVRGGSTSSEDTFNCQTYDGGLALFTVLGNGNVVIPTGTLKTVSTISVGNATPSTSGAGITFPATQSASSNANTLDDYEEGTWTPTVAGSTTAGSVAYSYQNGYYTKIGRLVYVWFDLEVSSFSGGAGGLTITSFPFSAANLTNGFPTFQPWAVASAYAETYTTPTGIINPNNSLMNMYSTDDGHANFSVMKVNQTGRISGYVVMQTA